MSKQKGRHAYRNKIGSRVLNTLSTIFLSAGTAFSQNHNAIYGVREFVAILTEMARLRISSENAVRQMEPKERVPTAKWFRNMMHSISVGNADDMCNTMISNTARLARKTCGNRPLVAIDKHLIPRYDKNNMMHLVYSKFKAGTKRFESYVTMQLVDCPANVTLACMRETRSDSDPDFVRKFVHILKEYQIRPRLILADREFYSVDVIRAMYASHNKFLIPAVKNSGIKRAILEHHAKKRASASRYAMKNASGKSVSFTLLVVPSKKYGSTDADVIQQYHVFATNVAPRIALREISTLPEQYRKRWGIETGYRQIEEVRPRTTSRDATFRMLLFYTALFLYNMWAIQRNQNESKGEMTMVLIMDMIEYSALRCITGIPYDPGGVI